MAAPANASEVTFAILNYNGRELLAPVLASISKQSVQGFVVHVVDDASTDGSLAYLAEQWPGVIVLPTERNLGVSAAMARAVATTETPYLALLNNDLELDPLWLGEMLAELARHPDAAAADGKMLTFENRKTLDGAGDVMGREGYPRRRGQGERDVGQFDAPCEVFSATGGAALFRRAAFETVGVFDADLGAYYEDVDWGFRARLLGMTARYVPKAVCVHRGSATTGRDPGRYAALIVRNQLIVLLKNFPGALLARQLPSIAFFQVKWLVFDMLHGVGHAHLQGLAGAFRLLPQTLRKRRAIQRSRTASWREVLRALS
jgi:GT2 family glycosyltransferase